MLVLQLITNGIIAGSMYALLGLSFGIIFATTRIFHFVHGAVFSFAGYFAIQLMLWGLPFPLAVVLSISFAILLGLGIEWVIYRPLRNLGASTLEILLASMGLFILFENLMLLIWKADPRVLKIPAILMRVISFGQVKITMLQMVFILISLSLWIALSLFIKRAKVGRAVRGLENDPELTEIVGVDSERIRLFAYGVGSAVIAIAAIFTASDASMHPGVGTMAVLMAVVVVIAGGVGTYTGPVIAGFSIGIIENIGIWKIPSEWKASIAFGILLIFVIFKPTGILGKK